MSRDVPDGGRPGDDGPTRGDITAPSVPDDRIPDGFEQVSDTAETLFQLPIPGVSVRGRTVVYEDAPLCDAVRAATDGDVDQVARFFFATRLDLHPKLPPNVGMGMALPTVRNQAHNHFVSDLVERGFEAIELERTEDVGTSGGGQVELQKLSGRYPLPGRERDLPIEAWVGAWYDGDDVLVAGGIHPAVSLATIFEGDDALLERSPSSYRDDLLGLLRRVE